MSTYATVTDPVTLSFAPNGDLYVGRDLIGSGGGPGDPARIHRVLAGGAAVEEFGGSIVDPDAVLVDPTGAIAPSAGSVLVGSQLDGSIGLISAIAPDESVSTVFGPSSAFVNPSDMVFDGNGRLLFTDYQNQRVSVSAGGIPSVLFSLSAAVLNIAYDPETDRVYTSGADDVIRVHLSDGTLIDATFADGGRALAVGAQLTGTDSFLYTVDNATGDLIRIDTVGNATVIGSGFTSVFDLAFGPDGALYASEFDNDRIVRISVPKLPATSERGSLLAIGFIVAVALLALRRAAPRVPDPARR